MATHTDDIDIQQRHSDHPSEDHDPRSVVQLVKELRDETTALMRQEVALAKTEMSEKLSRTLNNVASLVVGSLVLYAGLLILLIAGSAGTYVALLEAELTHFTAGWLAPLIVSLLVLIAGYILVQKAISTLKNESLMPEETIASVKRTKNWAQEKVS